MFTQSGLVAIAESKKVDSRGSPKGEAMLSLFTTHINKVVEASGKKSLLGLIFSYDGLKIFADGNIGWVGSIV